MDEQQQRRVARGLREGKIEAWQSLYEAYARQVWRSVARRMGPDSADVADVVQETFLAAARSARRYDPARGSLWSWLSGIARKHVALHYRHQRRHQRVNPGPAWPVSDPQQVVRWLESRQATPAEALLARELAGMVRATLTELPPDYETLLTAKYLDGASVGEIAQDQQCSSTAVRSKLARARRAFRQAFVKACAPSPQGGASEHDES